MGPNSGILTCWYAIYTVRFMIIILNFTIFSSFSLAINNVTHMINSTNLDDYLYNYSIRSLGQHMHTGVPYNISLPANFSDMKVSVLRLRSNTLWFKGANYSYFDIPSKIITVPYVRRLEIMYENLGNLSSKYYYLPGYTLLTKVIGIAIYNASDLSGGMNSKRVNLSLNGDLIKVKFSSNYNINDGIKVKKCVRFDPLSGLVELRDILRPNVCLSQGVGHFAIAMSTIMPPPPPSPPPPPPSTPPPSPPPPPPSPSRQEQKKRVAERMWWVVGVMVGVVGLMLLVLCYVFGYGSRKIQSMDKTAENSEALETKWIGDSKFPFAPVTRTLGVLEEDFVP